jgi:chromosome segregation ATPase
MRSIYHERWSPWAATAILAALVVGCGSSDTRPVKAPPVQEDAVARTSGAMMQAPSVEQLKADLTQSKSEIDRLLGTLGMLTSPNTPPSALRPTYDAYADQLARMTQRAEQMKREAEQMRDAQAAYFARWEAKAAQIDNPSVRASAEARKSRLRSAQDRITSASLAARDAYEPFMRDLQDVRKYLGAELTPTSVQMLGDVDKKATADGAVVKQRIDAVIAELDAVDRGDAQ